MKNPICPLFCLMVIACLFGAHSPSPELPLVERSVTKSFSVRPGGTVRLDTQGGNIHVQRASDLRVTVLAREKIHAGSEADANIALKSLTLRIAQRENEVIARASYDQPRPYFQSGSWPPVQVDLIVMVPASFAVDLKSSGGEIVVGDLAGPLHADTGGGELSLGRIGGDVEAATGGGEVSLTEGRGAINLRTAGGSVHVGHAVGRIALTTAGGSIRIESAENALQVATNGGSVRAGFVGALKGDCLLETSGGSVELMVDQGVGFMLDAVTSGSEVDLAGVAIGVTKGGIGTNELGGPVNGGGPSLTVRSRGGSINVLAR